MSTLQETCLPRNLRKGPISMRTMGSAVSTRISRNIDLGSTVTWSDWVLLDLLRSIQRRICRRQNKTVTPTRRIVKP